MTWCLRLSSITSKPQSHPVTEGPASSREDDGGSGAVACGVGRPVAGHYVEHARTNAVPVAMDGADCGQR